MGLLDNIERLINEHGSWVILKKRIAQANNKYSALEKENIELKTKIQIVETENQRLKLDNEQLAIKIQNFEKLSCSRSNLFEEIKINILLFLSKQRDKVTDEQIAGILCITPQVVKFHMHELEKHRMVHGAILMGSPRQWSLAQEGRKYLIANKLIS